MIPGFPIAGKDRPRFFQPLELRGALFTFVAALVWQFAVRPREIRPDAWLDAAASIEGLDPFRPLGRPIWTGLVTLCARAGDGVVLAHALSAVLAALCAALLFAFLATIRFHHADSDREDAQARRLSAGLGALLSVLAMPLSLAAGGITPHTVTAAILLGALIMAAGFARDGRIVRLHLAAFLCGLATAEAPVTLLLLPLFAGWWLLRLWRMRALRIRDLFLALLCAGLGFTPFFANAWAYAGSHAAQLREFADVQEVMRYTLLESWQALRVTIPRTGWLLMILMTFVPMIMVFLQMLEQPMDLWSHVGRSALASVLGIVAVLQLAGVPGALVRMETAPALIFVGMLCAAWIGRWVGAMYVLAGQTGTRSYQPLTRSGAVWRAGLPLALAAGSLAAWIGRAPDTETTARWALARAVVDRLEGRTWLVADGTDDTLIALEARWRGRKLMVLDTSRGDDTGYMKWVGECLPDAGLRALAIAGLPPVLDEWLDRGPGAAREMAALGHPDLWIRRGFRMQPAGVLYDGQPAGEAVSAATVFARNEAVWTNTLLAGSPRIARHVSRVANDLGVWLAAEGRTGDAVRAFATARAWNDRNVPALLNLATLGAVPLESAQRFITNALQDHTSNLDRRNLGREMGYVLEPARWSAGGWPWIWSAAMVADERERLIGVGGEAARAVARSQVLEGTPELGRALYEALLKHDPADRESRIGLMRAQVALGRHAEARALIGELETNATPTFAWAPESASMLLAEGRTNAALALLQAAVSNDPARPDVWIGLLRIADLTRDEKLRERATAHLGSLPERPKVLLALAREALRRNEIDSARRLLEQTAASGQFRRTALENLLSIDFHTADTNGVREHARKLLQMDPRHPLANYGLAGLYREAGRSELAEAAYRASLTARPSPFAWADLAELLETAGRPADALQAAGEAIKLDRRQISAWDLKARLLEKSGDADGAKAAREQAAALRDEAERNAANARRLEEGAPSPDGPGFDLR